jgi:hypothetical protein
LNDSVISGQPTYRTDSLISDDQAKQTNMDGSPLIKQKAVNNTLVV